MVEIAVRPVVAKPREDLDNDHTQEQAEQQLSRRTPTIKVDFHLQGYFFLKSMISSASLSEL